MNINALVDSLMVYAQENLLLDDLDYVFLRNQIIQKLKIKDYEEYEIDIEMIDDMQNPYQILNQISAYAVENGIIAENSKESFETEIMSYLLKRPSEIADMFNDLIEQDKSAKAFMWLNEYNLKGGFVKFQNILRHWEAKGTKGKIEVFVVNNSDIQKTGCSFCPENEGFGRFKSLRKVPLNLDGEELFWQLEENPCVSGLGYGVNYKHKPFLVNQKTLNRMFDFVELTPNYFIAMSENQDHGYFTGAPKQLPIHKAPEKSKLKSSEYPYINLTEVDWYTNVIRCSCTNREKLIEFVLKFVSAYKAQKEGNNASISVRKTDKYIVDIMLQNLDLKISEQNQNIFTCGIDLLSSMGIIVLGQSLETEIKQMELYLTKEAKYTESALTPNMIKHKNMIAKMLKDIGSAKISSIEALIDIKEEINNICESALSEMRVYNTLQEINPLYEFLQTLNVK